MIQIRRGLRLRLREGGMKRQVDEFFLISFFYVENTATKTIYYIVKGKTE